MDILDIDEMLKDDSFHFLEEKNPDDVSNIIQQWKNQNCFLQQQQQQQHQDLQQQQQQNNETYKLDSRTFTRPKRRTAAQKLEAQFLNLSNDSESQPGEMRVSPQTPMLNVQIGGQMRTPLSGRSMLQDVSPPSSIASMDLSLDNWKMDNSLITSADFTHLNFLLSTPSVEDSVNFNERNCAGYTLNDMIRDRKALESLTLSADDGTLIKDSQISQIDDISLSLLKSSSGCNSMANSAEDVEGNNFGHNSDLNDRTLQMMSSTGSNSCQNQTVVENNIDSSFPAAMNRTTIINTNNGVGDSTFTWVANDKSFIINRQSDKEAVIPKADLMRYKEQMLMNATFDQQAKELVPPNKDITSIMAKTTVLNETVCLGNVAEFEVEPESVGAECASNETYDCQKVQDAFNKLQYTPEHERIDDKFAKMYESTPHTTRMSYGVNVNTYRPAIRKIVEEANISPIIAIDSSHQLQSETPKKADQAGDPYRGSPVSHYAGIELLENGENQNKTYNRRSRLRQKELEDEREQRHKNTIELQDIMDLAQAEAELLGTANDGEDDEQHFEHMLDELSKIKLNPEQLKMQKSLEKIKKRFNCTLNQGEQDANGHLHTSTSSGEYGSGLSNTFTSETRQETLRKLRDTLRNDSTAEMTTTHSNPTDPALSSCSSTVGSGSGGSFIASSVGTSGSTSGERLLSRRSRLNDDVNLTSIKQLSQSESGTDTSKSVTKDNLNPTSGNSPLQMNAKTGDDDVSKYKLSEHRERDRDRFKTIKIVRNKNEESESATQTVLNVPCIDDDHNEIVDTPLEEGGNTNLVPLKNENASDNITTNLASTKRFSRSDLENSERGGNSNILKVGSALRQPEARSLSRPRYISGLQKFSVVSKAASADDLETNDNRVTVNETKTSQLSRMYDAKKSNIPSTTPSNSNAKPVNKLKSPMGIKAKSLHNLAYSNQGSTAAVGATGQVRSFAYGARKINSGGFGFEQQQQRMQKQSQQQTSQLKPNTADVFKKPAPISNRTTAGIARPSSAYYSLNVVPKTDAFPVASDSIKPSVSSTGNIGMIGSEETKLLKNNSNTGIPKPSGIRPPNKRSGLPRPSSMVRR